MCYEFLPPYIVVHFANVSAQQKNGICYQEDSIHETIKPLERMVSM